MKFSMNTAKMNSILGRLGKGVGNSRILPITEFIKFELTEGVLTMTATDSANFIKHVEKDVEGQDGTAIVKADKLIKLVSKTSKSKIDFELKDTFLAVKGNGNYKVDLFETDEYPTYEFDETVPVVSVNTATLKKAFNVNKSAIAVEMFMPCLTAYNIGTDVVTTDGVKMCLNDTKILDTERALIPQNLADLLMVLSSETVEIQKDGNKLLFKTPSVTIFGTELEGLEEYPDVSSVTDIEFGHNAVVNCAMMTSALDRLSLFVDNTTNFGIKLTFDTDFLYVEDLKGKSKEALGYVSKSENAPVVNMLFSINYLTDLLSAVSKDNVKLFYDEDEAMPIKLQDENVTLILSTMAAPDNANTEQSQEEVEV